MKIPFRAMCVALLCSATGLASAQLAVYPAKGQSADQQNKDQSECKNWAVGQTGYDPARPPPPPQAAAPAPGGQRVRGAAAGATVAAITDNDVGDAAVAGAVAGGVAHRSQRRQANRQQQQAATQQTQAGNAAFDKAMAACLEGRGYTVK
ncbi:hypothetical protein [Niveibacterium sp. SC-1]|uniref:hypothetical protein n=1 Tax=Niveibacterium sp. SC-1 TaxID=3135646 RepID=UPI00311EF3A4